MPEVKCGFDNSPDGSGSEMLVMYGPTLFVDIGFDNDWKLTNPPVTPVSSIKKVEALVDTGATESCIDDMLAVHLNLPVIDRRPKNRWRKTQT